MLDRTQQRILGVLIEKELSVPDTYPLTTNALLAGCNQKSNRDPEMSLEPFELSGALMAMRLEGWVFRVESSRADRFRHDVAGKLGLDDREKAVLAELLVRGPQAAGALKARVARMGFAASSPAEVEEVLEALRDRATPLVELLPRGLRERDPRWAHLLGAREERALEPAEDAEPPRPSASPSAAPAAVPPPRTTGLEVRLTELEAEVASLRARLARLEERAGGHQL